MASHQKAPYERMCEDWRRELKQEKGIYPEFARTRLTESAFDEDNRDQEDLQRLLDIMTKSVSSSKSETIEKIKNQHWYFIKFQTFCKCEITPESELVNNQKYKPFYYVLAEVKTPDKLLNCLKTETLL